MRQREIAALIVTFAFCLPTGTGQPWGRKFGSTSSSLIHVQLAQEGGPSGEYSTDGPTGDSSEGPVSPPVEN